jgi:hypothetical protein
VQGNVVIRAGGKWECLIFVSAPSSHAAVEATCMGETATIVGTENSDTLNGTEGAASTPCGSRMAQRAG